MQRLAELHCHTRFSDGAADPFDCVRVAGRKGLRVLAITDHNTAEGAVQFWDLPIDQGILVIPGEEISTDRGHMLAYFVHQTIQPGPFEQVLAEVRRQGALAFMAHPYHIPLGNQFRRRSIFKLSAEQLSQLDGIEVENGHNRAAANRLARSLAGKENLRAISGSDAHHLWEIGNACTQLEISELSYEAVRACLIAGNMQALPRRRSALSVYYWVGLKNRFAGKKYSWKENHEDAAS